MTLEALSVHEYVFAVWKLVIRPPRRRYTRLELCGQFGNRFRVGGNMVVSRTNYEITNEPHVLGHPLFRSQAMVTSACGGEVEAPTQTRFEDLALSDEGKAAMRETFGYEALTDVQQATFQSILEGSNLLVRAKTGAGKTLSFLLPTMDRLHRADPPSEVELAMLILSPVRELSMQIHAEASKLADHFPSLKPVLMVGGSSWEEDVETLDAVSSGYVVLVATPGRLQTHLEKTDGFRQRLSRVQVLVLDEADQLSGELFGEVTGSILEALDLEARQNLFYSATISEDVQRLIAKVAQQYTFEDMLAREDVSVPESIVQTYQVVPTEEMTTAFWRCVVSAKKHFQDVPPKIVAIFLTGRVAAYYAEAFRLSGVGLEVYEIHSRLKQQQRTDQSDGFRAAESGILFTSDVTSRGLDYPGVTAVIQVGAPDGRDEYIHRVGRTGRASSAGLGVLLLHDFERDFLDQIGDLRISEVPLEAVDAPEFAAMKIGTNVKAQAYYSRINHVLRLTIGDRVLSSCSRLRKLILFYYALMFVSIWMPEAGVSQRAVLVYHFIACVCYVDSAVHIPASLVMFLGRLCHGFMLYGKEFHFMEFAFDHGAVTIIVIIFSIVLERTLRDRLAAQFRNSDAESMISAFRQMLRGVCDGEVLLDDNLRIQEGAGCLNRLLSPSDCLDKKIFPDLLLQDSDELERFEKFISQPLDLHSSAAQLPAPCLRLSLQSSNSQRAGVDVYHVALQHLFGCEGSYHLLGLKLDVESQAIPDAAHESAGMASLRNSILRRPPARSQASSRSGGTLLRTVSNVEELMMLVHDRDQQPVSQIHFKYRETSSSSAQGDSVMPDLKSLIRPTDWETVRASIARHAAGDHCLMELPRIWVKAFERQSGYVQARRVSLKPCRDTARSRRGYLWLHLRDLRFEEKQRRAPSELADLAEMHGEGLDVLEVFREGQRFASSIGALDEEGRPPALTEQNAQRYGVAEIDDPAINIVRTPPAPSVSISYQIFDTIDLGRTLPKLLAAQAAQHGKVVAIFINGDVAKLYAEMARKDGSSYEVYEAHSANSKKVRKKVVQSFAAAASGVLFTAGLSAATLPSEGVSAIIMIGLPASAKDYGQIVDYISRSAQGSTTTALLLLSAFEEKALGALASGALVASASPAEVPKEDPGILEELNDKLQAKAYFSWLRHYALNPLLQDKLMAVQEASRFAEAIGALSEGRPPALAPRMLADMGIEGIADDALNVAET
ncbi:unnamed protein product [Symbiodinium sp. CCMP2456]|nr:unnamed protein product [Symbiodinium sp. CCMP2456]